jgi:hypothetical protein
MWRAIRRKTKAIPRETWAAWFVLIIVSVIVVALGIFLGGLIADRLF